MRNPALVTCLLVLGFLVAMPADAKKKKRRPDGPLITATGEIDESRLLDVGVEILGLGVDESEQPEEGSRESWTANPDIRRSEAVFIPFHLKSTLESTGFWGAVRVVPPGTRDLDLIVSGHIEKASPQELTIALEFTDATGRSWRRARYIHRLPSGAFPELTEGVPRSEPYQPLYDKIANDMLEGLRKLSARDATRIRQLAELRFAAELSPELFGDYVKPGRKGRIELARLPAVDDAMVQRVRRIRERDYAVVDTLNEYYASFYEAMDAPYWEWRQFSLQEYLAWKKIRKQARRRKVLGGLLILGGIASDNGGLTDAAVLGGIAVMKSGVDKGQQAKIHREALGELAGSFDSELTPLVIEVEGRMVKLEGTARSKYEQWRGLLREIFAEETGLTDGPESSGTDFSGRSSAGQ
jgi:hypothetical protein